MCFCLFVVCPPVFSSPSGRLQRTPALIGRRVGPGRHDASDAVLATACEAYHPFSALTFSSFVVFFSCCLSVMGRCTFFSQPLSPLFSFTLPFSEVGILRSSEGYFSCD